MSDEEGSNQMEMEMEKKEVVKPKSVHLGKIVETVNERNLRLKRERLQEIKQKLAEPGGNFGIGIFNTGKSYNKFTTKPYEELAALQKKENRYRRVLGLKKNRQPINNTEKGYKPALDPRALRAALKTKSAYYGGGKLNMIKIEGTKTLK